MMKAPLILSMLCSLCAMAQDGPWLSLDRKIHNLGKVKQGAEAADTVRFTNTGNAPLLLFHVITDCHCTAVDYPTDTIAPGAEGFIAVTYKASAHFRGEFRQNVRIRSNALNHREIVFIDGTVVAQ